MIRKELENKINTRTKPLGSLGKLEKIALQIGTIQQTLTPELKNPAILLFAADHGIADEGVSPCPKKMTWQMLKNFANGGAGINVFARQHNIKLRIIDGGVDYDFCKDSTIENMKLMYGTNNMLHAPAMTTDVCRMAMENGAKCVLQEFNLGCNVIGFGEMGIGNTSPASLLLHKITDTPLEQCVGRGAGLDDSGVQHKLDILKKVSKKYAPQTPLDILATFGGLEIAMITGAVLEAKRLNMLIVADGFITSAAFLMAYSMQPNIIDNVIFSHASNEGGHKYMVDYMNGDPLLHLDLRLGEGTGVALAYPILQSALIFLNEMVSFDEANVYEVEKNRKKI